MNCSKLVVNQTDKVLLELQNRKQIKRRSGFFRNFKYSLFGRKCCFLLNP